MKRATSESRSTDVVSHPEKGGGVSRRRCEAFCRLDAAAARSIVLDGKISALQSEVGALSNQIASLDSELTFVSAVFNRSEAELVDPVDTLQRDKMATSVMQKETAKKTALLQKKIDARNVNVVVASLAAGSMRQLSSVDKQELVALAQSQQSSDDENGELSHAAEIYKR